MTQQPLRQAPSRPQQGQNRHLRLSHTGQSVLDCAARTPAFSPRPRGHWATMPRRLWTLASPPGEVWTTDHLTCYLICTPGPHWDRAFSLTLWAWVNLASFSQIIHLPRDLTSLYQLGSFPGRSAILCYKAATLSMLTVPHAWKPLSLVSHSVNKQQAWY